MARAITQVCSQCQMPLVLPASFAGKTVPCSRCGHAVLVAGGEASPETVVLPPAAQPIPRPPVPRPPHLERKESAGSLMMPVEAEAAEADLAEEEAPQPRSCFLTGCLMVGIASLALSAVLGVALLSVWLVQRWPAATDGGEGQPAAGSPRALKINKREYRDASRRAITHAGVTVRIDRAAVGRVDYRSKGEILQTATPNYLIVNVNVKNKSRAEPVEYQSWYDNEFENDTGERQDVHLVDENGVELKLFRVPGAENVERHGLSSAQLPPGDDLTDSLVFKLPEDYLDEPIPPLYLKLPVAAVGDTGDYHFLIPGLMVVRRDR